MEAFIDAARAAGLLLTTALAGLVLTPGNRRRPYRPWFSASKRTEGRCVGLLAAVLALLSALVLAGNALLVAGWVGAAPDADRVLPNPEVAMGARWWLRAGSGPLSAAKHNANGSFRRSNMARDTGSDDERAILDAIARVLGRDGHEVAGAADPTAVLGRTSCASTSCSATS